MSLTDLGRWRRRHSLALAVLHFLYVWVCLNPRLFVDAFTQFPAFLTTLDFARPFFLRPSGPGDYLAAALAQSYTWGWLGALLLTALTGALCLGLDRVLRAVSGAGSSWISLLPVPLLLALYNQTGFHPRETTALALAVGAAGLYCGLLSWRPVPRLGVLAAAACALYYLCGGFVLLFLALAAIMEGAVGGGWRAALLCLLFAVVPPLALTWLLPEASAVWALNHNTPADIARPIEEVTVFGVLWGLVIAAAALTALRARAAQRDVTTTPGWLRQHPAARLALAAVLLIGPVAATCHPWLPVVLQAEALAGAGRLEEAMRLARHVQRRAYPPHFPHQMNLALFRAGRLSDEMFHLRQTPDGLMMGMQCGPLLLDPQVRQMRRTHPYDCAQALFELGLVNQAIHEASEPLEENGPQVRPLKLLAQAYLAKGQPETARLFLETLTHAPRERRWARETLAELERTGGVSDTLIKTVAANQLRRDTRRYYVSLHAQCESLLDTNPANRMAYEYLMNFYLLNRALNEFVARLDDLPRVGLKTIPRHWQEAIVLWEAKEGKQIGLAGYTVDPLIAQDFIRFSKLVAPLQQSGADRDSLIRVAGPEFGNTYYFYYITVCSGVGRE